MIISLKMDNINLKATQLDTGKPQYIEIQIKGMCEGITVSSPSLL